MRVHRLVGCERYDTEAAVAALNLVYAELRLFQNLLLPTVTLVQKARVGAQTRLGLIRTGRHSPTGGRDGSYGQERDE